MDESRRGIRCTVGALDHSITADKSASKVPAAMSDPHVRTSALAFTAPPSCWYPTSLLGHSETNRQILPSSAPPFNPAPDGTRFHIELTCGKTTSATVRPILRPSRTA